LVFRSLPSRIGALLDLTLKDLERILYNEAYIVLSSNTDGQDGGLQVGTILSEAKFHELKAAGVEF
jgi:DNA-directed RNA polymerase subunit beta'